MNNGTAITENLISSNTSSHPHKLTHTHTDQFPLHDTAFLVLLRCGHWLSYLCRLQGLDLSGEFHGVSVEVVHGDGVVPVAQVVLLIGGLLLPPHAAHCKQDS